MVSRPKADGAGRIPGPATEQVLSEKLRFALLHQKIPDAFGTTQTGHLFLSRGHRPGKRNREANHSMGRLHADD